LEQLSSTVTKAQARLSAPGAVETVRFSPGDVLAGRYRIVLRVGKGGMGEIYRANDLELGQAVALKFLPQDLQQDESRLARFRREVSIARQVAHPNVCRVYDIGQVDGQHFLSMEYIDGEDLGSLLRRIGRLPSDKAIEIAREFCAGLAAAHEKGVLHRDLKPSNIMIDGRGKVRLTDFGIAGFTGQIDASEVRHGTPAFMAPEQWAGREVSIKSDIYSLGLVLYELFTGKRAFKADTADELMRLQQDATPRYPTSLVEDLDPAVERAILACLEKDPGKRPPSALAVAAALPGGDPLAAALAAGETPSPELVAEAGEVGALRPAVAWAYLAGVIVQILLFPDLAVGLDRRDDAAHRSYAGTKIAGAPERKGEGGHPKSGISRSVARQQPRLFVARRLHRVRHGERSVTGSVGPVRHRRARCHSLLVPAESSLLGTSAPHELLRLGERSTAVAHRYGERRARSTGSTKSVRRRRTRAR
jgi:serine/threonine-protein kinase